MGDSSAILVEEVSHRYGERLALDRVSFHVAPGEAFGLLGPNGGGKSTLFRLLATLLPLQEGSARIGDADVRTRPDEVRGLIGVTFQSPSLDGKLTVGENLRYHAALYGLSGSALRSRIDEVTVQLSLADRLRDRAETLSGGLQRRVEVAKSLLHRPRVLLLDEPSTGLDPGARHELWQSLESLIADNGVTILVTTHLMDEAERCHRLGILDRGRLVALGAPDVLRGEVGGDCITIDGDAPDDLAREIAARFGVAPEQVHGRLRIERPNGQELVRDLMNAFPSAIRSITLGKPTLEDVFLRKTGRPFEDAPAEPPRTRRSHQK
jgi:ABC-2 type transport system ATP-binding protein